MENQIKDMKAAILDNGMDFSKPVHWKKIAGCDANDKDGKTFTISVDPDNKVKTIKDAIKEIKHVEATRYTLKKGTHVLNDNKTI